MTPEQLVKAVHRYEHLSSRSLKRAARYRRLLGEAADVVAHAHGPHEHAHAWGSMEHSHLLRAICLRPECMGCPTHDIHKGPDE